MVRKIPNHLKLFRPANEIKSESSFGWDDERKIFTNNAGGTEAVKHPELAPKYRYQGVFQITINHYERVINTLNELREQARRLGIVIPRQAIHPGNPEHPQPELRQPHIISELFLKPGKKQYNSSLNWRDSEKYAEEIPSKEDQLRIRAYDIRRGVVALKKLFPQHPQLMRTAVDAGLLLAEKGIPLAADALGLIQTSKGPKLVIRDPDNMAMYLYQLETGNTTPYRDFFDFTLYPYLDSLSGEEKRREITRIKIKVQKSKMPDAFKESIISQFRLRFARRKLIN